MKLFKQATILCQKSNKKFEHLRKTLLISLKIPVYLQIDQWIFRINHFSQLV